MRRGGMLGERTRREREDYRKQHKKIGDRTEVIPKGGKKWDEGKSRKVKIM